MLTGTMLSRACGLKLPRLAGSFKALRHSYQKERSGVGGTV